MYFGLILSVFNLDLFTAFLWLAECVIVFVSILMLFYLNVYGFINKQNDKVYSMKFIGLFILLLFMFFTNTFYSNVEINLIIFGDFYNYWDDYYESLFNIRMNDVYILYISYYVINSLELIVIGVILLIASIVCVNLNKYSKTTKTSNYTDIFNIFDIFKDFLKFGFIRKQNLTNQTLHNPSIKIFKKKIKK